MSGLKDVFSILHIEAISKNKLLGQCRQEIYVPGVGFPGSQKLQGRRLH